MVGGWLVELGGRGGGCMIKVDDRNGCHQSPDCPEAMKPATVRLVDVIDRGC